MKTLAAMVLCLALAHPAGAAAQRVPQPADTTVTPTELALAGELLDLMRLKDVSSAAVLVALDQQVLANPSLEPFRNTMLDWGRELFASREARDAFARLYAESFAEEDLRGLIAFYRTPLGQRLAASQVSLSQRGAEVGRQLAVAHQAELMARIQQVPAKP